MPTEYGQEEEIEEVPEDKTEEQTASPVVTSAPAK
tara:strand:+ start:97 stop:201 length:105 start_codon:yes stop_codon:yes gene_type:complete